MERTNKKDYQTDEEEPYFEEQANENQFEDLTRENAEFDDLSTEEEGEEELKEFYYCMTNRITYEEIPEKNNF